MILSGFVELKFNTEYRVCVDLKVDVNKYEIGLYSVILCIR